MDIFSFIFFLICSFFVLFTGHHFSSHCSFSFEFPEYLVIPTMMRITIHPVLQILNAADIFIIVTKPFVNKLIYISLKIIRFFSPTT